MKVSPLRLTLLIPGLFGPGSANGSGVRPGRGAQGFPLPHAPTLAKLLSRAHCIPDPVDTDALRYRLFGYALSESQDHPDAWLSYHYDTGAGAPGALLRADPVHLRADPSRLILFGPEHLQITADEAQALTEVFNRHYAAAGLRLELPTPRRGYLHLPQQPDLRTTPLPCARGRDVDACLPVGREARHWHRFLNEVQMLFHDHPVNRARTARGRPSINSLWLWGGGLPLAATASDWHYVWSHDATLRGLAWLNGIRGAPPPADAQAWLQGLGGGRHLLCLDDLRPAVAHTDVEGWLAQVEHVERAWFAPLLQALGQGRLRELQLYPDAGHVYRVTRRDLWCFWRSRRHS